MKKPKKIVPPRVLLAELLKPGDEFLPDGRRNSTYTRPYLKRRACQRLIESGIHPLMMTWDDVVRYNLSKTVTP